jgi:hypothetical protein
LKKKGSDSSSNNRKTAGELSLKALADNTKYDPLEVGHALTEDIYEQLCICAERHEKVFGEDEFFLVIIVAGDPLIKNVRRHKYCALLFLPQPRPQQTIFLYNRHTQKFRRLWSLPDAKTMAVVDTMDYVAPQWENTKRWVRYFYAGNFFNDIRHETGITHLSEKEFIEDTYAEEIVRQARLKDLDERDSLNANREKSIEPVFKDSAPGLSNPFDFSKIMTNQVINS